MLVRHGSRSTTPTEPSTNVTAPNGGRFGPPAPWSPATADVLVGRVGWRDRIAADTPAHRPHPELPDQPACAAASTGRRWHAVAAGHARTLMASPCRERACYPGGWDW
jgi:hypothetical protein